jgi:class 3 adenylate cyclase
MRCAAEIQRGMIIVSRRCPTNGESGSAIGINLGDVIAECGDIFGDG